MMATAIGCDLCQAEPAEMMQTNLGNGETISVGAACMATFFAGALTAMLSDAPPEALNGLSAVLVPLSAIIGPDAWNTESDTVKAVRDVPHTEHDTGPREDGGVSVPDVGDALQSADDLRSEHE